VINDRDNPFRPETRGWEDHNLSQLRYFRSLSLREKLEALEGMADVVRRLQLIRTEGGFKSATRTRLSDFDPPNS
jgi:hypothetical protein